MEMVPKHLLLIDQKVLSTGIGNNGALLRVLGVFFVLQSGQLLTQCSQSVNMFFQ